MEWETFVQVRYNQLITYDRPEGGFRQPSWRKPPTRKGYTGEITASTKKRIETAVDVFLQCSPKRKVFNPVTNRQQDFQLSFITLTIAHPDPIPASEGHKALKVWLQHFKKPWSKRKISEPMTSYIWKAELQSRGQLHYHLTTNAWLHFAEIRRVWNDLQRNRGWLEAYKAKAGHYDPNSTDVHSIYKIRDVRRYLSKYISKQEYTESPANPESGFPGLLVPVVLDGKVWGCSEDLKGKKRFSERMDKWTWLSMEAGRDSGSLREHEVKHCKFYDVTGGQHKTEDYLSTTHLQAYQQWKK
jgi:hypothetical protein